MPRRRRVAAPRQHILTPTRVFAWGGLALAVLAMLLLRGNPQEAVPCRPAPAPPAAPEFDYCDCPCEEDRAVKALDGRVYDADWAVDICRLLAKRYPCQPPYCGERRVRAWAAAGRWLRIDMHVPGGDPGMGFIHCPPNGRCEEILGGTFFGDEVAWIIAHPKAYYLPVCGYMIPKDVWPFDWQKEQAEALDAARPSR